MLDHRFGQGAPYTLGVEEEYQLLDGQSFDLVQHIEMVLAAVEGHELEPSLNTELMQSVLEIATPVCRDIGEVMRELTKIRGYVCSVARAAGDASRLRRARTPSACSNDNGSRPRTGTVRSSTSSSTSLGGSSSSACTCTSPSTMPDKAIKVVNGLLPQLAPLLALSASSPFWRGEPTGPLVEPANGVLRHAALRAAAPLP